jgi:hypothetical protein
MGVTKPCLGRKRIVRQLRLHRLLHQPFALRPRMRMPSGRPAANSIRRWQRLARFQPHRHRGAIDLGQNIARQPEFEIGILRRSSPERRRLFHQFDKGLLAR